MPDLYPEVGPLTKPDNHTLTRTVYKCLIPQCTLLQDPAFRGRRVVTFHNQRDFVFFRCVPNLLSLDDFLLYAIGLG
jgi:hypothetical protein